MRKLLKIALFIVIILNLSIGVVFADNSILKEIKKLASANYTDNQGQTMPLEVDVTVNEIALKQSAASLNNQGKVYAVTVKATTVETDSGACSNSIPITGQLKMVWQDNPGPNNKLISASISYETSQSGIKTLGGSIKNFIRYGEGHNAGTFTATKGLRDVNIVEGYQWNDINLVRWQFHVNTQNTFTYEGKEGTLKLQVNSSF